MANYIDRQAAIDIVRHECGEWKGLAKEIVKQFNGLPAADVVPVTYGKWIPHREKSREYIGTVLVHVRYDYWLCDTCGYRVENGQPIYNFCPNCGAKMDGERKEKYDG